MTRRARNLRDWWIHAASTIAGLFLVASALIHLANGLDSITSDLISLLIGLPLSAANARAWADAEIQRQVIANEQEGQS